MAFFPFFSSRGVLGMNARNLLYVRAYNPRKAVAFADDKLKTKLFLSARGVPVPRVFATISTRKQLHGFDFSVLPDQCVLKPNYGFGGEGIKILHGRRKGEFLEKGKEPLSHRDLIEHIEDILDGKFSINGRGDTAFFEELIFPHECFAPFRPAGLPDIRVVVFNMVPVMAMLRIPTGESQGKANLHLGGIGLGLDLAKGATTFAVQRNKRIDMLPHGADFRGIALPYWDEILLISSKIQQITNIGYLAVDLTIDAQAGPKLLEVNARAGLAVQVANLAPLQSRLERVKGVKVATPEKGVLLGKELFGKSKSSVSSVSVPTIGLHDVIIIPTEAENIEVRCHVSTEHDRSAFSPTLIKTLKEHDAIEVENEAEKTYRVRFVLGGKKIQTIIVERDLEALDVSASVGKRDLKGLLIDPSRDDKTLPKKRTKVSSVPQSIDRQLAEINQEIPFLRTFRPLQMESHLTRLEYDKDYEPVFTYEPLTIDIPELRTRLSDLHPDNSSFGKLLKKKQVELLLRLDLLEARGDSKAFTTASKHLFGEPTPRLLNAAKAALKAREACPILASSAVKSADFAKKKFEKILAQYGLHDWEVSLREHLISDCAVGGKHVYLRATATFESSHIDALIAHEIEAHVLSAENAKEQPYELLRIGMAGYLDTQEGLAIYLQKQVLPLWHDKIYWAPRGVLGVAYALKHGFADTRKYLEEIGYTPEKALRKAISMKRGMGDTSQPGAFTRDVTYFRGTLAVEEFVKNGGDLRRLYIGRVALDDLDAIEELPGIKHPILLPVFLRNHH